MSQFRKGQVIRVRFEIALPVDATGEEIDDWVAFAMGAGSLSLDNPLSNFDLESIDAPDLDDTGSILREEVAELGDGRRRIRRWKERVDEGQSL